MSFIKTSVDEEGVVARAASASDCSRRQDDTRGAVCHAIGRFRVDFELTPVQKSILQRAAIVYTDAMVEEVLRPMLEQHEGWPSIRVVDWLLTNFAKSRRVVCTQMDGERINVFLAYKAALSFFRRRNFDAFRRRLRIRIQAPNGELESTVAQLNFYAWAHQTGILVWCRTHAAEIERDMNSVASRRRLRTAGERRRTELSVAPRSKVAIYDS